MCTQKNQCCSTTRTSERESLSVENYVLSVMVDNQERELSRLRAERDAYFGYATELAAISKVLRTKAEDRVKELALKALARGVPQADGSVVRQRFWINNILKLSDKSTRLLRSVQQSKDLDGRTEGSCCPLKTDSVTSSVAHFGVWMEGIRKACRTLSKG